MALFLEASITASKFGFCFITYGFSNQPFKTFGTLVSCSIWGGVGVVVVVMPGNCKQTAEFFVKSKFGWKLLPLSIFLKGLFPFGTL